MDEKLLIAIIAAPSAIIGGLVAGMFTLLTNKLLADREDRRIRDKIVRMSAQERLNNLYYPLIKLLSPVYGVVEFNRDLVGSIIKLIDKNEKYASPDLLSFYWEFSFNYSEEHQLLEDKYYREFNKFVYQEFKELKDKLGFGNIVKKPTRSNKIINYITKTYNAYKEKRHMNKIIKKRKGRKKK